MATLFLISGQVQLAAPETQLPLDKLAHFLVFGALATSWVRLPRFRSWPRLGLCISWILAAGFGALDEFHQSFTPGRVVEVGDWIADALGAALAVILYRGWPAYRRMLERPVGSGKTS